MTDDSTQKTAEVIVYLAAAAVWGNEALQSEAAL
jgi:hypothetical protein